MSPDSVLHLFKRAGPAGRALLDGVGHRVQLARLELTELGEKIASSVLLGVCALVLALLGGIAATFAIAAAVWHREDRGLCLGLLTLAYFVTAGGFALSMRKRLKQLEFLPETSRQLHEDRLCLGALLHDEKPPGPQPIP
jgi:uncharacterized membrane protein YqjE